MENILLDHFRVDLKSIFYLFNMLGWELDLCMPNL